MQAKNLKIVCLGDSITWGFPFGPGYSWVRMLDDALEGEFINQGINGNTTSDMLRRFDQSVLKYNPSHVIIMGGCDMSGKLRSHYSKLKDYCRKRPDGGDKGNPGNPNRS